MKLYTNIVTLHNLNTKIVALPKGSLLTLEPYVGLDPDARYFICTIQGDTIGKCTEAVKKMKLKDISYLLNKSFYKLTVI